MIDVLMWGDEYEDALMIANQALKSFPNSEEFLF